jgi:hypothetical protein
VPCEYTSESRTSHGPSKGYVHHLESKLRELQNAGIAQNHVPADRPQLFSAINKPRHAESSWSTPPSLPFTHQYRGTWSYGSGDNSTAQPLPASPAQIMTQSLPSLPLPIPSSRAAGPTTASPDWGGPVRARPLEVARLPDGNLLNRTLTPSALRDSMEAPSPLVPSVAPIRPLFFNRTDSKARNGIPDRPSPHASSSTINTAHVSVSPAPRPAYFTSRRTTSFVRQIRSAFDSRLQSIHTAAARQVIASPLNSSNMEPRTNVPKNVDYVLPSRKTADSLMRIYWDTGHSLFPFLDRTLFEKAYDGIWSGHPSEPDESLMMCTLNVVFALASQYSDNLVAEERETASAMFFDRAQDLLNLDLWSTGSIELVQCLLLMALYFQSINSLQQCWMVGGLATRFAESLGLHLRETSANAPSIRQREHLRRLWHGCIFVDRYVIFATQLFVFALPPQADLNHSDPIRKASLLSDGLRSQPHARTVAWWLSPSIPGSHCPRAVKISAGSYILLRSAMFSMAWTACVRALKHPATKPLAILFAENG